jgi:hypothetical protein
MHSNKNMHMIRTDLQRMHLTTFSKSSLPQRSLATPFNAFIHKYTVPILRHKHNVERTLAIAMAERLQTHIVSPPRR